MKKKSNSNDCMKLFIILLLAIYGNLFANGVDKNNVSSEFKQLCIEFLMRNGYSEDVNSEYFEITIIPLFDRISFRDYFAYQLKFKGDIDEYKVRTVLVKDNIFYNTSTKDYNKMLKYEKIEIDSLNIIDIFKDYLHIINYQKIDIESFKFVNIDAFDSEWGIRAGLKGKYYIDVEIHTYQVINGVKTKWSISFKNGYFDVLGKEILAIHQGDYIKEKTRLKGI